MYGICDTGDYWDATFSAQVERDLGMVSLTSDPKPLVKRLTFGAVPGLLGSYVDDCLLADDHAFQELTKETLKRFWSKERTLDDAEFVGVRIATLGETRPRFTIEQRPYVDGLKRLLTDALFKAFLSSGASDAWLADTRPDLCCGSQLAAQVTEAPYGPSAVRALNVLFSRAKKGRDLVLTYPQLDVTTLRVRVYADASYATNTDGSSQVGCIVLLFDIPGLAHVLSFTSRKCRRVVRSIMAGEVYAFSAAFDEAFIIRYDLEQLYGCHFPINIFTDAKQLLDVVTKATHPTEKRLMVNIAAVRQAFNRGDTSNVGLIGTDHTQPTL